MFTPHTSLSPSSALNNNEIAMNAQQRKTGSFTLSQQLRLSLFQPTADVALCGITIACDVFTKKPGAKVVLDNDALTESFMIQFGSQVFRVNQSLAMDFNGTKLGDDGFLRIHSLTSCKHLVLVI